MYTLLPLHLTYHHTPHNHISSKDIEKSWSRVDFPYECARRKNIDLFEALRCAVAIVIILVPRYTRIRVNSRRWSAPRFFSTRMRSVEISTFDASIFSGKCKQWGRFYRLVRNDFLDACVTFFSTVDCWQLWSCAIRVFGCFRGLVVMVWGSVEFEGRFVCATPETVFRPLCNEEAYKKLESARPRVSNHSRCTICHTRMS